MIHKLSGIHETVDFRENEQVCLYYNDEYENYPPHWHTSFEVLMPIVNGYKALCGGKEYNLREGDVLIIGVGQAIATCPVRVCFMSFLLRKAESGLFFSRV